MRAGAQIPEIGQPSEPPGEEPGKELDYLMIFVVTIPRTLKTQHDRVLEHPCWFYQSKSAEPVGLFPHRPYDQVHEKDATRCRGSPGFR